MDHDVAAGERARRRGEIENVALDEREMRVLLDVGELQRVPMKVVVDDDFIRFEQALDEVRSDEARAAGDADPLSR